MSKKIKKPFSLEEWENGAKVETRGGQAVRLLCSDLQTVDQFRVVGLRTYEPGKEFIDYWDINGNNWLMSNKYELVIVEEV